MILLVNGDSHTAGAEAVNSHAFAEDDPKYVNMQRSPHPDNLKASWGLKLSKMLNASPLVLAESASSNDRIIRTTNQWLVEHPDPDVFIIIQWSTWEREEWLIDDKWFQVNASGIDDVPDSHKQKYKEFVANVDWNKCTNNWFKRIKAYHKYLDSQGIKHLFFNGNTDFGKVKERYDFGKSYIDPYSPEGTYHGWLQTKGHKTVSKNSYHYDSQAHSDWSKFMVRYLVDNKLV